MNYETLGVIVEGYEGEQVALDHARGFAFDEIDTTIDNIAFARHVATINGVGVYYDYGADYYFFTNES